MELEKDKDAAGFGELFTKTWKIPLFIAIGIMFVQQFVGINTVIYYAPTIFLIAGFEGAKAAIAATVSVGIINVLATVVSMFLIDKIGRRKLYFIGLVGMCIALAALGAFFIMKDSLGDSLKWVTVSTVLIYIVFFAISLGPLGWLIISEIFPTKYRGVGVSVGAFSNWFFNGIVAFTFLKLAWAFTVPGMEMIKENAGAELTQTEMAILEKYDIPPGSTKEEVREVYYQDGIPEEDLKAILKQYQIDPNPAGSFFVYSFIAILGILWGLKYIPETKGVTLEEIEEHWRSGKMPNELNS